MLAAAVAEFGAHGLAATTEAIARRAGVSQPYVYSLFKNKKMLFIAAWAHCCDLIEETLRDAAEGLVGEAALQAMAVAYDALLKNRELLQMQLQTWAVGAHDPEIRSEAGRRFEWMWELVGELTGSPREEITDFMSTWTLYNVAVSLDLSVMDQCRITAAVQRRGGKNA
jgi:AcrR family transcriptional regulator